MHFAVLLMAAALADSSYALAPSENFSIYAPSQPAAESVLERAEAFREELAVAWCGERLPRGDGWTMIHVRVVADRDRGRTSPEGHGDSGHVLWIQTDDPAGAAFDATLKHELMHCLLATRHPDLPVWVHEGCAGQYDIGERQRMHEETVARFVRTGSWPSLRQLFAARRMSPADRVSYGTAVSLAAFLIEEEGRRRFLEFAAAGTADDWEAAVRTHYGWSGTTELQRHWQRWVAEHVAQGNSGRRTALSEGSVVRRRSLSK